jgi:hypothetical protein
VIRKTRQPHPLLAPGSVIALHNPTHNRFLGHWATQWTGLVIEDDDMALTENSVAFRKLTELIIEHG